MLILRAAGMYRRFVREQQKGEKKGNGAPKAETESQSKAQRDMLLSEIDNWLAKANKKNTTDRLIVPSDEQLKEIVAMVYAKVERSSTIPKPPSSARAPPTQKSMLPALPASAQRAATPRGTTSEMNRGSTPRGSTPRDQQQTAASFPPPLGYMAAPLLGRREELNEKDLLREIEREAEEEAQKYRKGLSQKRAQDLWAQIALDEVEQEREEEKRRKQRKRAERESLRLTLENQVEAKKAQKYRQLEREQEQLQEQQRIQQERQRLEEEIDAARARKHEAEKQELIRQTREAELLKQKAELKNKLIEHQTKKAAEKVMAEEAARQTARRLERERIAFEAVAQNEKLKKIREEQRKEEQLREQQLVEEAKAQMEAQERRRLEHLEKIHQKQTRSIKMSMKLQDSLDAQMAKDAERAEKELAAINAKKEDELRNRDAERRKAKEELRRALKEQVMEHEEQRKVIREEGVVESQLVAEQAAQVAQSEAEAKKQRKLATLKNREAIQKQIDDKNTRRAYEATQNMTDSERALNKKYLLSLSERRARNLSPKERSPPEQSPRNEL